MRLVMMILEVVVSSGSDQGDGGAPTSTSAALQSHWCQGTVTFMFLSTEIYAPLLCYAPHAIEHSEM